MIRIRLKEIANEKGLSQARLKEITGLSDNTIRAYYYDQVMRPDFKVLETICETLGIKLTELIVREGDEETDQLGATAFVR